MYISQFALPNLPITNVTLDDVTVSGNTTGTLNTDDTVGILQVGQGATLTIQEFDDHK